MSEQCTDVSTDMKSIGDLIGKLLVNMMCCSMREIMRIVGRICKRTWCTPVSRYDGESVGVLFFCMDSPGVTVRDALLHVVADLHY